jgi:hypothetical protein
VAATADAAPDGIQPILPSNEARRDREGWQDKKRSMGDFFYEMSNPAQTPSLSQGKIVTS